MGATGFGYDLARQFGLAIRETRPALVPLLFGEKDLKDYADMAGVSAEVVASCDGQNFREKLLITHRGLSGPAVLQISSYWKRPQPVVIDLAPDQKVTAALIESECHREISRLCARRCRQFSLIDWPIGGWTITLSAPGQTPPCKKVERQIHEWAVTPVGTEGYGKAGGDRRRDRHRQSCRRRRWSARKCLDCSLSEK